MRFAIILALLGQGVVAGRAAAQPAKAPRVDIHGDPLPARAIARLGSVRFQSPGFVASAALSPDGKSIAVAVSENAIHFMDAATGTVIRKLDSVSGKYAQFTPDSKAIVVSGDLFLGGDTTLISSSTGKVLGSINLPTSIGPVAMTADGSRLAFQRLEYVYDAPIRIWDVKSGKEVTSIPGRGARCQALRFGADGKRVLLWSTVPAHAGDGGIGFDGNSKVVLACIDVGSRKIIGEIIIKTDQNAALSPDGETVAYEDADNQRIRVRHLPTGTERAVIPVKQPKIAFMPDGKALLAIDKDGQAALWDIGKKSKIRDLAGKLANKQRDIVGISNDGKTIAASDGGWTSTATIVVWNAASGQRAQRPAGHEGAVTCLAYGPGGKLLASGSIDKTVRLWNPLSGKHVRQLATHKAAITAVAFARDGSLVASASADRTIRVSNVADGELVNEFIGPEDGAALRINDGTDGGARALAFSRDGKTLFAGGNAGKMLAWELASRKEITRVNREELGPVTAFAADGSLALISEIHSPWRDERPAERLHVWDPMSGKSLSAMQLRTDIDQEPGSINCTAAIFSPTARVVAGSQVAERAGIRPYYGLPLLRVWERISGQPILTIGPTVTTVLAFSPDGRMLASGGAGQSGHLNVGYGSGIDIWDTFTGTKADKLPVTPKCIAYSPDGTSLATASRDQDILIWHTPRSPQPGNAKPSAFKSDEWWSGMGAHARLAYKVIAQMIDAPDEAVALLARHVRPVQPGDPAKVAGLIAQLDSKQFVERASAQAALENMGEGASHGIKQALKGKNTEETRRRLQSLLHKTEAISSEGLRLHRAIATLEWIGNPASRDLLRGLAGGMPGARLTEEAQAALRRFSD